jgi:hypothetical protein
MKTNLVKLACGLALLGAAFTAPAQSTILGNLTTGPNNSVNLTTLGTEDWAIWGYSSGGTSTSLSPNDSMAGGSGISSLTYLNPNSQPLRGLGQFAINYQFAWDNGNTVASASGARGGLQDNSGTGPGLGVGEGFSFTVPASTTEQELNVFVDEHLGVGQFTAALTDGTTYSNSAIPNGDNSPGEYTINFAAATADQTLTVTWKETSYTSSSDNAAIYAVTLEAVPEPTTLALAGLGGLGLLLFRRRK